MIIFKDDPRLYDQPDVEPKWERPVFMAIWFDFNRKIDSTFVNRQAWWLESETIELWPKAEYLEAI